MIAAEISLFKRKNNPGITDVLPQPKETLSAPARPENAVPKYEDAGSTAMDVDEELRMQGQ